MQFHHFRCGPTGKCCGTIEQWCKSERSRGDPGQAHLTVTLANEHIC